MSTSVAQESEQVVVFLNNDFCDSLIAQDLLAGFDEMNVVFVVFEFLFSISDICLCLTHFTCVIQVILILSCAIIPLQDK